MSLSRIFFLSSLVLLAAVGAVAWVKQSKPVPLPAPVEVPTVASAPLPVQQPSLVAITPSPIEEAPAQIDQIETLFALDSSKLPVVETVSYTTRVPWLNGRPAWIADYASHYETSRHFIARSLNRGPDYFTQKVAPGDRFNVFRADKKIAFHLLVDLAQCQLSFYCLDLTENQRYLLKTYPIAVGKPDDSHESQFTTPLGKYLLGDKVAIYKPGMVGFFQDQKTEMIRVFGTRWLPFGSEIEGCTEPAKGLGLHGAPWIQDKATGQFVEDLSKIGRQATDGCIHLSAKDIEEIFAIVLTKPTTVEIVKEMR
jgi:hypothetical protein